MINSKKDADFHGGSDGCGGEGVGVVGGVGRQGIIQWTQCNPGVLVRRRQGTQDERTCDNKGRD